MKQPSVTLAWAFAAAFLAAGVLGFVPNPILGQDALFLANTAHNLVHVITAAGFAAVAYLGARASTRFMQVFGVVYMLTGVVGFLALGSSPEGHLLGVVHINRLDNFLHLGLGVAIAAAGWFSLQQARQPSAQQA